METTKRKVTDRVYILEYTTQFNSLRTNTAQDASNKLFALSQENELQPCEPLNPIIIFEIYKHTLYVTMKNIINQRSDDVHPSQLS